MRSTWPRSQPGARLPFAWIGSQVGGLRGLFLGIAIASVVSSLFGVRWLASLPNPNGDTTAEKAPALTLAEAEALLQGSRLESAVASALAEVQGLRSGRVRGGRIGVFVGRRELLNIQRDGRSHLPLPVEIGDNLVRRGLLAHHGGQEDTGWYQHRLEGEEDASGLVWVLRLTHLLYELSQRGAGDPITQAELDAFTATEACVASMRAAAERWEEAVPLAS